MYFKINLARIITPVDIKPLSLDFQEKNEASVRVAKEPDFRNTFLKIDGFVEAPKDSGLVSFVCSVVQ